MDLYRKRKHQDDERGPILHGSDDEARETKKLKRAPGFVRRFTSVFLAVRKFFKEEQQWKTKLADRIRDQLDKSTRIFDQIERDLVEALDDQAEIKHALRVAAVAAAKADVEVEPSARPGRRMYGYAAIRNALQEFILSESTVRYRPKYLVAELKCFGEEYARTEEHNRTLMELRNRTKVEKTDTVVSLMLAVGAFIALALTMAPAGAIIGPAAVTLVTQAAAALYKMYQNSRDKVGDLQGVFDEFFQEGKEGMERIANDLTRTTKDDEDVFKKAKGLFDKLEELLKDGQAQITTHEEELKKKISEFRRKQRPFARALRLFAKRTRYSRKRIRKTAQSLLHELGVPRLQSALPRLPMTAPDPALETVKGE